MAHTGDSSGGSFLLWTHRKAPHLSILELRGKRMRGSNRKAALGSLGVFPGFPQASSGYLCPRGSNPGLQAKCREFHLDSVFYLS